ncbi:hypothetical protein AAHE18_04G204100 [Arachis hypogaea]
MSSWLEEKQEQRRETRPPLVPQHTWRPLQEMPLETRELFLVARQTSRSRAPIHQRKNPSRNPQFFKLLPTIPETHPAAIHASLTGVEVELLINRA